MIDSVRKKIIDIDPNEVIKTAQEHELDVQSIEDFRTLGSHYDRIRNVMESYRSSFARSSAFGGLTTGIGGFASAVTFASIDTISLALQLYRLAQRYAILNGFDGNNPLQKDKMLNIYFEALSINGVIQASLKHQFLKANAEAGNWGGSNNLILKFIMRIGRILGEDISSKRAGRYLPLVGGMVGATVNYSFAKKTSKVMQDAFKDAYFETWQ